jgi:hypothetical protein
MADKIDLAISIQGIPVAEAIDVLTRVAAALHQYGAFITKDGAAMIGPVYDPNDAECGMISATASGPKMEPEVAARMH